MATTLAAEALNDGRDPLTTPFLSENHVTFDECYSLAEHLAIGARLVASGLDDPYTAVGIVLFDHLASGMPGQAPPSFAERSEAADHG